MRKFPLFLFACTLMVACGDKSNKTQGEGTESNAQQPEEITQEHINNSATAENPKASDEELAVMTFKNTFHDFGDIVENQTVETTYEFTNTGKVDLLISSCNAQCGCTVPDWPRQPIHPGESGKIKVAFNSAGKGGENNKIVTVYANIPEKSVELKFKAKVKNITQNN